jgi:hypothetical protein
MISIDIQDRVDALRLVGLDSDAMDLILMHDDRVGNIDCYGGQSVDSDDDDSDDSEGWIF